MFQFLAWCGLALFLLLAAGLYLYRRHVSHILWVDSAALYTRLDLMRRLESLDIAIAQCILAAVICGAWFLLPILLAIAVTVIVGLIMVLVLAIA